ncbi:Sulfotransferase family protein [Candidatus Nitrotoga sp. M5]|nr:Sulfotransferase family protein [Candidatus Nitrotoga sp. M5]
MFMMHLETIKNFFKKKQSIPFSCIVGSGRCGTTMLAKMLNSHSMICVPPELQILFEYSDNGPRLYEIFKEKKNKFFGPKDFMELIDVRCPKKLSVYFDYMSFFEKQQYPIHSFKKLVNSFYSEIAESKQKKIFIDRTPWYGQRIDIINELFPDAKYIHMIRDGRDVAISYARTPWWHDDIGQNLERWHAEVRQIIDSSNQFLHPNQMLQVRYEDFVDKPEVELRRICEHLGVNFEYSMLDTATHVDYSLYRKSNLENISSEALKEWSQSKNIPTFKGSRYAWKSYKDFDFSALPEHINQSLHAHGYEK